MAAFKNGVREFTASDWQCFAGAERWKNGAQPVCREIGDLIVLADLNVVEAVDSNGNVWIVPGVVFPTQASAAAFLSGLPEDLYSEAQIKAFGFKQV